MWHPSQGITQSILNRFLECPYSAYLYLILGLHDPSPLELNLEWGDILHKGLELFIPEGNYSDAVEGMFEYQIANYPSTEDTVRYSTKKMLRLFSRSPYEGDWKTEVDIDTPIKLTNNTTVRFRGKIDTYTNNHPTYGKVRGDHKCKGYTDPTKTREEIEYDLQMNAYLHASDGGEWIYYDLIKIPEAQKYKPARKNGESAASYIDRLFKDGTIGSYNNHYPIMLNKSSWIHQGIYHIPQETQEKVFYQTISPCILRLLEWYDYVTDPSFSLEDPNCYNSIFYLHPIRHFNARKTAGYNCPYHAYLIGELPLEALEPVTSYFPELEEKEEC